MKHCEQDAGGRKPKKNLRRQFVEVMALVADHPKTICDTGNGKGVKLIHCCLSVDYSAWIPGDVVRAMPARIGKQTFDDPRVPATSNHVFGATFELAHNERVDRLVLQAVTDIVQKLQCLVRRPKETVLGDRIRRDALRRFMAEHLEQKIFQLRGHD